jgi:hypothetical protein
LDWLSTELSIAQDAHNDIVPWESRCDEGVQGDQTSSSFDDHAFELLIAGRFSSLFFELDVATERIDG